MNTVLQNSIIRYRRKGWTVTSQVDNSVYMVRKKRPKPLLALVLLVLGILPGLLYIFWPRKTDQIFLYMQGGKVRKR